MLYLRPLIDLYCGFYKSDTFIFLNNCTLMITRNLNNNDCNYKNKKITSKWGWSVSWISIKLNNYWYNTVCLALFHSDPVTTLVNQPLPTSSRSRLFYTVAKDNITIMGTVHDKCTWKSSWLSLCRNIPPNLPRETGE